MPLCSFLSLRRREYAARARARAGPEGGGSWPFGGDAGPLPPVEIRRFLWWQDEAAAVEEEEVEVERRMAAKRRKRSVAELFAAVPRVPRGGGHQGSGKGKKAAKRRKAEKDKGKLVLAVTVKTKKKKKVPAGVDVREKVAHCISLHRLLTCFSISGIAILSGTIECLYSQASTGLPELCIKRYKWILLFS